MNVITKAFQPVKNHSLKDTTKSKSKNISRKVDGTERLFNRQKETNSSKTVNSIDQLKHGGGKTGEDIICHTRKDTKFGEDYDVLFQRRASILNGSELFEIDNSEGPISKVVQGDQKVGHSTEQSNIVIEENKRLTQMNILQKKQIDKLLKENESVKELNYSLTSKSEVNSQILSHTVDVLQKKISELNTRLETHQMDVIEKEKSIKQLIEILQDVPKQLHNVMHPNIFFKLKHDSFLSDISSGLHKDLTTSFPMLKINYNSEDDNRSIKVLCRVKLEIDNCLIVPTSDTICLPPFKHFDKGLCYRLNKVFGSDAPQNEIFSEIIPLLPSCFARSNVCVITYGQSGSGKTHTMIGSEIEPGIMILAVKELIRYAKESSTVIHRFYLTILEIYNENIYDLMSTGVDRNSANLNARVFLQDNGHSVQIKDVSEAEISEEKEFMYHINKSLKRRSSSVTVRNLSSSRSHYLVMIRISGLQGGPTEKGSLIMCDLAGSENCNGLNDKEQNESKFINKSITMLTRVFDALYRKLPTIPFRDSKLTHILKPSLMGNAKCVFIATVCSNAENINDTYRTLNVAKKVEMIHFNNQKNESL